jgi:hypothetical protein
VSCIAETNLTCRKTPRRACADDRKLRCNEAGSIDLFFDTELSQGDPESELLRTFPGKGRFNLLRLSSSADAYLDQIWGSDDFEKLDERACLANSGCSGWKWSVAPALIDWVYRSQPSGQRRNVRRMRSLVFYLR